LTDYRERSLKDVITQLEPGLFKKVTGLDVKDFELLCSIGVFNASLMNDAIFKFKRYEDSSLSYTGIEKHNDDEVGGWDTAIRKEEYEKLFYNQQATMSAVNITLPVQLEGIDGVGEIAVTESKGKTTTTIITTTPTIPTTTEKENTPVDTSTINVGTVVVHKTFGKGTVIKIDKARKYIFVRFAVGEKQFVLQSAFDNGFLRIE
jgi:hypothetical protein